MPYKLLGNLHAAGHSCSPQDYGPLHVAAMNGDLDGLRALLAGGANVNETEEGVRGNVLCMVCKQVCHALQPPRIPAHRAGASMR